MSAQDRLTGASVPAVGEEGVAADASAMAFTVVAMATEVARRTTTVYPPPYDGVCEGRTKQAVGNAVGMSQFGVNRTTLAPGAWTAQRHWHTINDEMVIVVSGEVVLVTECGERVLHTGEAVGFPAGKANGHCIKNVSEAEAVILEIGAREPGDGARYPDIDMQADHDAETGKWSFTTKGGAPLA
ncbi:cupin domain-containing protein [Thecamonas trahens ATCC 50062]|uniref:Cupin domain-containing protein n=1 Tax=Thecamonas trahens ATCC 50062 TaxID=461836 RepID=A0A0L0DIB9_THETB|nr:cupin domain-containing protein [Thecamonas trahens ATCC 50062]KNC52057.1 cupin domain-containing protein [Thecamonas trahens ATCC 50062]|eukprot:XP_013762063.1 cupin domain-containing protein [Thecamonas trahens ATCC 50062]